jgi:Spy/CpxP family protein refolding chaperone
MRVLPIAVIVGSVMLAAPLSAQQSPPTNPPQQQGRDSSMMQGRLNEQLFAGITLTAEQKTQVDSIQREARDAENAAGQVGGGMGDATSRDRLRAQRQATMASIRAILTPDQQTQFDRNLQSIPVMQGGTRPGDDQNTRPPETTPPPALL